MKKILSTILLVVGLLNIFLAPLNGCTGIQLTAKDRGVVVGRTMEWGHLIYTQELLLYLEE